MKERPRASKPRSKLSTMVAKTVEEAFSSRLINIIRANEASDDQMLSALASVASASHKRQANPAPHLLQTHQRQILSSLDHLELNRTSGPGLGLLQCFLLILKLSSIHSSSEKEEGKPLEYETEPKVVQQ